MLCMFCKATGCRLIRIDMVFQSNANRIKDDIIELCGPQIRKSLKGTDVVCTSCMIAVEKAVALKRRLLNTLLSRDLQVKQENKKQRTGVVKNGKTATVGVGTVKMEAE